MTWSPSQYLKFADHRMRPAVDLLGRVDLAEPREIVDLGAGAGNVTRLLAARWPRARIVGVDASAAMLAKAAETPSAIVWEQADLATWRPQSAPDLIYSNAALHWVGDHARLFPSLFGALAPGGVLAVQMPRNSTAPSHTLIAEAALDGPWRTTLAPLLRPPPTAEPSVYYGLLAPHAASIDLWETEYVQVLEGEDPVKEWTKGTWLAPLLAALAEPERSAFEAHYARLVAAAYPRRADGRTLLPFRRLFFVAVRAD
jgi:trans-aconitate 2-methyltransferase